MLVALALLAPLWTPTVVHGPEPTVSLQAKSSQHEDTRLGFKFKPPKDWTAVPLKVDENWQVAKYLSPREYIYNDPQGWTWEHRPQLVAIAFPAAVVEKDVEVDKKDDKTTEIRILNPYKNYEDYLARTYSGGGYYVAAACERITAHRSTITGSIGVIMSAWNFGEAAKKFGVEQVAIKSERTPFKDILSPTRAMRDDERALLTTIVDELLDQFITVVDEGREQLDRAAATKVATGAIFTARQALELGLVDEIGDIDSVVAWFGQKLGRPVTLVEARRRAGLGDLLFGAFGHKPADAALTDLLTSSTGPRFLYYWQGGR